MHEPPDRLPSAAPQMTPPPARQAIQPRKLSRHPKRLARLVSSLASPALWLLAPTACVACKEIIRTRRVFCAQCLPSSPETGDLGTTPFLTLGVYAGALERAVRALKYQKRSDLAGPLGALLAEFSSEAYSEVLQRTELVVPVPLHSRRLRQRGYNQAGLLASAFGRSVQLPVRARALWRVRETRPLPGLSAKERFEEVAGAIRTRTALPSKRVLLIDDVLTSGATLRACASALRQTGAFVVGFVALARAGEPEFRGTGRVRDEWEKEGREELRFQRNSGFDALSRQ